MKLHLGCGDRYIDGYVNVDGYDMANHDTSRKGSTYDLKANILEKLPFDDGSIDEIMIIHVMEHFYRWQSISLLNEFRRLLKKGGIVIIEMPDLDRCIEWYTSGGRCGGKTIGTPLGRLNKGFTQFYGNQWDELEYETHKYVWTQEEIVEEMKKVGFSITELTNKTKYHMSGRDMRIVGVMNK